MKYLVFYTEPVFWADDGPYLFGTAFDLVEAGGPEEAGALASKIVGEDENRALLAVLNERQVVEMFEGREG